MNPPHIIYIVTNDFANGSLNLIFKETQNFFVQQNGCLIYLAQFNFNYGKLFVVRKIWWKSDRRIAGIQNITLSMFDNRKRNSAH